MAVLFISFLDLLVSFMVTPLLLVESFNPRLSNFDGFVCITFNLGDKIITLTN